MVKYVLVVEASGVHVAAAARVLADLEEDLGLPLPKKFDLFAGNGFGGVLALALASEQFTAHSAQNKITSKPVLAHILETSPWRRTRGIVQDTPLATGSAKHEFFKAIFKDNVPVRDIDKAVVVQAYDTTARTVVTITSKGDAGLFNPTLAELADAATATPVYFPHTSLGSSRPHETTAGHGGRGATATAAAAVTVPHFFIDASVVNGSALLPAIAEARRLWPREDRIVVVVIGPGRPARSIQMPPSGLGGPQWLQSDLVSVTMEPALSDVQLRYLLGGMVELVRINGLNASVSDDIDDTLPANLDALDALGHAWYQDCRAALIRLLITSNDTTPVLSPTLPAWSALATAASTLPPALALAPAPVAAPVQLSPSLVSVAGVSTTLPTLASLATVAAAPAAEAESKVASAAAGPAPAPAKVAVADKASGKEKKAKAAAGAAAAPAAPSVATAAPAKPAKGSSKSPVKGKGKDKSSKKDKKSAKKSKHKGKDAGSDDSEDDEDDEDDDEDKKKTKSKGGEDEDDLDDEEDEEDGSSDEDEDDDDDDDDDDDEEDEGAGNQSNCTVS